LAERIDAMSLRERALIFLAVAMVLIVLVNTLLIDPLLTRHKKLQQQIRADTRKNQCDAEANPDLW